MPINAFVDSNLLNTNLTSIADAIRDRRGLTSSTKLTFPTDFISQIDQINPYTIDGPKNIISNGIFNAQDDNLDGYSNIIINVHPGIIAPIDFDNSLGYVANGTWTRGGTTVSYSDIYEVEADVNYIIMIGSIVGTRFRVMFSTININDTQAATVKGISIQHLNDPSPYTFKSFKSTENGYVTIQKDNQGISGIPSYLFKTRLIIPDNQ